MGDVSANREDGMPDEVFQLVIHYIDDTVRDAVSLVCRSWYQIEAESRRHVTIWLCYTVTPQKLWNRFKLLESLKLKGQPRAAKFNLIPKNWGGHATPWVNQLASFTCLTVVHFRRMIVTDTDLQQLCLSRGIDLLSLKLDNCFGFSTDGLLPIGRHCRKLITLYLEGSKIIENDGDWLHEIALNNTVLKTLNIYETRLDKIKYEDLTLIAKKCPLISVKLGRYDLKDISDFLKHARDLEKFYGVVSSLVKGIIVGDYYFGELLRLEWVLPFASGLKKLDLSRTKMTRRDYLELIARRPNLEALKARKSIGDHGLRSISSRCKKLRKVRIEHCDLGSFKDEEGYISHEGVFSLIEGCPDMEYIAIYVSSMTNACLELMGRKWKKLKNFRMVLLKDLRVKSDLPLDNGVRELLQGCELRGLALYLRRGALSDIGLGFVGMFATNVTWMLLSRVGTSDIGLQQFSRGCPNLRKLEMRDCHFTEKAVASAVSNLKSLRYFWNKGYGGRGDGRDLAIMLTPQLKNGHKKEGSRSYWNIELIGSGQPQPHMLGYYSVAGQRLDFPDGVTPFRP